MKKQWKRPNVSNLSVEDTMGRINVIYTTDGEKATYGWQCCCGVNSNGYPYKDSEESQKAAEEHESSCQDPCLIS